MSEESIAQPLEIHTSTYRTPDRLSGSVDSARAALYRALMSGTPLVVTQFPIRDNESHTKNH
jgi:hypothetical protein